MKKITFLSMFIVLLISGRIIAQPTLTAATNNPIATDVFTQHQTAYTAPGAAGANVTWNFSTLTSTYAVTNTFSLPSATPYASTFPTANLASLISDGGTSPYYSYYIVNSNVFSIDGWHVHPKRRHRYTLF